MARDAFLVTLTHRRGGTLFLSGARENSVVNLISVVENGPSERDGFQLYASGECVLCLSTSTTAEVLRQMYEAALKSMSLEDVDVKNLYFGHGPGSFTGLRLGSAFLNGLHFGRARSLYAFATPSADKLCQRARGANLPPSFLQELEILECEDEFSVFVTRLDMLWALEVLESATPVSEMQPAYGRLPGPVLKLKSRVETP